jgi:glycosyltransferase involved in cell wall biosynthesis
MRLVVFGSGHPYRGGVARTTTEMVTALESRGHDVSFFTPRRQYPAWLFPGRDDRDPDACPRLECAQRVLDPLSPLSWPRSRRLALAIDADAWIIPYWTWAWSGLWRFLLSVDRPPATAVVHNPADHDARRIQRLAAGSVLRRCQALFTHASVLEIALAGSYPGLATASHPLPPSAVGPLPPQSEARAALGVGADRRVALFVGLIRPYKGVDLLLDAVARLPEGSDWQVIIAGEPWGDQGRRVEEQARRLGIEDRVWLKLGWIPETEVPLLLAASDIVVLPYRSGSQSAVAPMALGAGVPVLSTTVGGLPEVVQHGVDGWLVEPGSINALVGALEELDGPRLSVLARGAVDGRNRFTWDGYAEALESLVAMTVADSTEGPVGTA